MSKEIKTMNIYEKLNIIKKNIREHDFIMDKVLPSNLGASEYASIGQYYTIMQTETSALNIFFKWEVIGIDSFERDAFKVSGKIPQHVTTVECLATFINIDKPDEIVTILTHASGSDTLDKGTSSASTMAFRNFFDKNFTPKYLNQGGEEIISNEEVKTEEPKIPAYIPPEKKEEIKKEVVETKQPSNDDDIKRIVDKIMKIREIGENKTYGASTLTTIMNSNVSAADLLAIELKLDNKLDSLGGDK